MHREHFHQAGLPVRVPRGNDGFWKIMCRLNAEQSCFTVRDIDGESNASIKNISKYLRGLVAAGYVEQIATRQHDVPGKYPTPLYRLLKQPLKAPRVRDDGSLIAGTAQEQLWTAIRTLKTFNVKELVFAATTDDVRPKVQTAARFLRMLHTAGYLSTVGTAGPGNPQMFRLKPHMNTGPLPPSCKQVEGKFIWDPNLEKFVGAAPIAKEAQP